jgi:hypothetical protein
MSQYVKDLLERVVVTFLGAFLAVFTVTDVNTAKAAAVAGAAAVLSLIKGLVAKKAASADTASLVL